MGTHPIFESDFDCLTERNMSQITESIWSNRCYYEAAMDAYQVFKATGKTAQSKTRKLVEVDMDRVEQIESENKQLKDQIASILKRLEQLEGQVKGGAPAPVEEDYDDVDLFGSDDEDDAAAEELKAKRIADYNARKAAKEEKKGKVIAKSNIIFDVKPWDDETDMAALEANVRTIEMEGLLWGTGKLVAIGYGIKKLQITCVIVDDLVSTDLLEEKMTEFEDFVQSVDVVAFNKI